MLNVYPSEQIKPSRLLGLPNRFARPAFEKLYGFDVPADQTLRGQPGLFDDIIITAPLVGTVRYATDIEAIMVYSLVLTGRYTTALTSTITYALIGKPSAPAHGTT